MEDVFYTILIVWIIWKVMSSINSISSKDANRTAQKTASKEGETTIDYVPPKKKSRGGNDEGEYVDYEEIK
jgi:hypothetical protein